MMSAFTLFTVLLLAAWLIVFAAKRELRQEMLILSIAAFFLSPVMLTLESGDPNVIAARWSGVHFADLLFAFAVAGLAGSLFHALFGKHYHRLPKLRRATPREGMLAQIWLIRLLIGTLVFLWGIVFCVFAFGLSPAAGALATAVIMAVYMVVHRHDLLTDALLSAGLTALVTYMSGATALFLHSDDVTSALVTTSDRIGHVPADLVTLALAFGLALGPLYEYIRRIAVR